MKLRRRATSIIGQNGVLRRAVFKPPCQSAKSRDGLPFGPCATCARCRRNASHLRYLRETAVQAQVRRSARLQNGACRLALFGRPDTLCLSIQRPACNTGRVSGLGLPSAVGRGINYLPRFSVDYLANSDRSTAATTRNKVIGEPRRRTTQPALAAPWAVKVPRLIGPLSEASPISQHFTRHHSQIGSSLRPWLRRRERVTRVKMAVAHGVGETSLRS